MERKRAEFNSQHRASTPTGLGEVLDALLDSTEGQEKLSIGDVLEAFGRRSFGPLILVPAILLTLPTGALPGVPLVLGALIALVAIEMLVGRGRPSVPSLFCRLRFSRAGVRKAREKISPILSAVDSIIQPRMRYLIRPPILQLAALTCIALALLLIPVEVIPFATAIPGSALILIGLAITAEDGLAMLVGLVASAAVGLGVYMLMF